MSVDSQPQDLQARARAEAEKITRNAVAQLGPLIKPMDGSYADTVEGFQAWLEKRLLALCADESRMAREEERLALDQYKAELVRVARERDEYARIAERASEDVDTYKRRLEELYARDVVSSGGDSAVRAGAVDHVPSKVAPTPPTEPEKPPLSFADLRAVNVPRCVNDFGHTLESWSPAEWTNAMCGEAGEAANVAKKILRHRDGVAGNVGEDKDLAGLKAKLARELADVVIYADLCAAALGQDLATAIVEKFNEVSVRVGSSLRLPGPPQVAPEPEKWIRPCSVCREPFIETAPGRRYVCPTCRVKSPAQVAQPEPTTDALTEARKRNEAQMYVPTGKIEIRRRGDAE